MSVFAFIFSFFGIFFLPDILYSGDKNIRLQVFDGASEKKEGNLEGELGGLKNRPHSAPRDRKNTRSAYFWVSKSLAQQSKTLSAIIERNNLEISNKEDDGEVEQKTIPIEGLSIRGLALLLAELEAKEISRSHYAVDPKQFSDALLLRDFLIAAHYLSVEKMENSLIKDLISNHRILSLLMKSRSLYPPKVYSQMISLSAPGAKVVVDAFRKRGRFLDRDLKRLRSQRNVSVLTVFGCGKKVNEIIKKNPASFSDLEEITCHLDDFIRLTTLGIYSRPQTVNLHLKDTGLLKKNIKKLSKKIVEGKFKSLQRLRIFSTLREKEMQDLWKELRALVIKDHFPSLYGLDLNFSLPEDEEKNLKNMKSLRLKHFGYHLSESIKGRSWFVRAAVSGVFETVESLSINFNRKHETGIFHCVNQQYFPHLKKISFLVPDQKSLDEMIEKISLPFLEDLYLSCDFQHSFDALLGKFNHLNRLGLRSEGAGALSLNKLSPLVRSGWGKNIRALDIEKTVIPHEFSQLIRQENFPKLQELKLDHNNVDLARKLMKSKRIKGVKHLDVFTFDLSKLHQLVTRSHLPSLLELDLRHHYVSNMSSQTLKSFVHLIQSKKLPPLLMIRLHLVHTFGKDPAIGQAHEAANKKGIILTVDYY